MDMCIIRSIVVTKYSEIGIASYLSWDGLLNLHEIWLHTDDIYLPYRVKHFDENHSSFRWTTLFHLHRCIPNDSLSKRYLCVCTHRCIYKFYLIKRHRYRKKTVHFFKSEIKGYFIVISGFLLIREKFEDTRSTRNMQ